MDYHDDEYILCKFFDTSFPIDDGIFNCWKLTHVCDWSLSAGLLLFTVFNGAIVKRTTHRIQT